MSNPPIHFNALYRSDAQAHVRYIDGERKEEPYYLYYYFREDGIWLSKTTDAPWLDVEDFLAEIDLAVVNSDPHHDEPLTKSNELRYQCGDYELLEDAVFLNWRHSMLEEEKRRWYFRIRSPEFMQTDFGEYELRLQGEK
ncbi:MAG TPA: hypothetical protein ENJ82_08420 [Bacteroidetes bacterium]|nr:hypothetical protein [Bacteroidota bacterium]